jgi:hypothetical protein
MLSFTSFKRVIWMKRQMPHTALIPKISHPSSVTEFWPINLCNVMYKLIFKVLDNRLKVVYR